MVEAFYYKLNRVNKNLFQSDRDTMRAALENGFIKAAIDVSSDAFEYNWGQCRSCVSEAQMDEKAWDVENKRMLKFAVQHLYDLHASGENGGICCIAGNDMSPTVCTVYLMFLGLYMQDAYTIITRRIPDLNISPKHMRMLETIDELWNEKPPSYHQDHWWGEREQPRFRQVRARPTPVFRESSYQYSPTSTSNTTTPYSIPNSYPSQYGTY